MRTTRLSRRTVGAVALCCTVGGLTTGAGAVATPDLSSKNALIVGDTYADHATTTYGAQRMASAMASIGYPTSAYTSGTTAANVNSQLKKAKLAFLFGHMNGGAFGPSDGQYFVANDTGGPAGGAVPDSSATSNFAELSELLQFVDIDDLKLLIFAGCDSDLTSTTYGNLPAVAIDRGVDATVSFPALVGTADSRVANQDYAGNYFWERAALYLADGYTIAESLSMARADLVAKEGTASGWNTYRIRGAVSNPSAVRANPGAPAHVYDSNIAGVKVPSVVTLNPASSKSIQVAGRNFNQFQTDSGIIYRTEASTGELVFVTAPTAQQQSDDAGKAGPSDRGDAERWLHANVPSFDASFQLVSEANVDHADGDALTSLEYRRITGGVPTGARVDVEFDRVTRSVTYLSVSQVETAPGAVTVSSLEDAQALTAQYASGNVVSVARDDWDYPRWIVTRETGNPSDGMSNRVQVMIDARDGDVTEINHY